MSKRSGFVRFVSALALVAACCIAPVAAEEVEKKWRIGLALGALNAQDEVDSDAANVLTIVDENFRVEDRFIDPRNDSAVFGNLDLKPAGVATLYAQYAVNRVFLLEASVGYQQTEFGDIEVQAQFAGTRVPETLPFLFSFFRVDAGDIERIPVALSGIARFRPRSSFNPYLGGGVGYSFVGFEPSNELNELSQNLDRSRGGFARLSSALFGTQELIPPNNDEIGDLTGAAVDVRDTFEWHILGGAELSFKRKWALFLDVRYTFASRTLSISFNGSEDVGIPVPNLVDFEGSEAANNAYGAVVVTEGGLIDGGQLITSPLPGDGPSGINCALDPLQAECQSFCSSFPDRCETAFDTERRDGEPDPGFYYVQGGEVQYDAFSIQLGVRYTF